MSDPRRVWGDDRARPRLLNARLALGSDPETVYALGEFDGSVTLEAWHAETGVRVSSWAVARGARLVAGAVRRGEHDDEVLFAVRGMARTEVIAVDLATGSTRGRLVLPRETTHVSSIARDGMTAAGIEGVGAFVAATRHVERVLPGAVAVSQDGALAALATLDQDSVRLFDVGTGTTLGWFDLPGEARGVALSFSGGDATLWAMGQAEVACWDLTTRVTLGRWRGLFGREPPVAFSPDGLRALLDRPIALAVGHERAVDHHTVAWDGVDARLSSDGRRLAARAAVLSWTDLARDVRVELTGTGHTAAVRALAASSDGARVASCDDATIRVWEAATGVCEWVLEGDPNGYDAVAFAPDGRTLYAVATAPRRLTSWSLHDGAETTPCELPFPGKGLQVSPDGRTLIARDTTPWQVAERCVVDLARFATVAPWLPSAVSSRGVNPRAGLALGFSREGAALEVFGHPPTPGGATFDLATGACSGTALDPFPGTLPPFVTFSPDGRWLVEASDEAGAVEVVFRAVTNGYNVAARCRFRGRMSDVPFAVGDHVAAVAEADGYVTVADRRDGRTRCVAELRSQATALALSPDEKTLYVGTHNGQVRVYSV